MAAVQSTDTNRLGCALGSPSVWRMKVESAIESVMKAAPISVHSRPGRQPQSAKDAITSASITQSASG